MIMAALIRLMYVPRLAARALKERPAPIPIRMLMMKSRPKKVVTFVDDEQSKESQRRRG